MSRRGAADCTRPASRAAATSAAAEAATARMRGRTSPAHVHCWRGERTGSERQKLAPTAAVPQRRPEEEHAVGSGGRGAGRAGRRRTRRGRGAARWGSTGGKAVGGADRVSPKHYVVEGARITAHSVRGACLRTEVILRSRGGGACPVSVARLKHKARQRSRAYLLRSPVLRVRLAELLQRVGGSARRPRGERREHGRALFRSSSRGLRMSL